MLKRMIIAVLDVYRIFISPLTRPSCRFYPSCSGYFRESVRRHGPWLGSLRGIQRLCRCHPWHPGGYDPVE